MSEPQDQIFLQNFIIILVMLLGMIAIFVIIARTIGTDEVAIAKQRAERIAAETAPVGRVRRSDTPAAASTGPAAVADAGTGTETEPVDLGKKIYDGLCFSCHSTGLANIPQLGDTAAWTDRIAQGNALLYERSIKGFVGESGMVMPAKGGNPSLSDDEVRAAVDYMVSNSQ